MSDLEKHMDVRLLVRWLGIDGAKAGLERSKRWTVGFLKETANELGIEVPGKPKRQELIEEIVCVASKRIDKSLDELFQMQHEELVRYFERVQVEPHELLDLLKKLNLDPAEKGRHNLLEFVASEVAETGRFMRIASKGNH